MAYCNLWTKGSRLTLRRFSTRAEKEKGKKKRSIELKIYKKRVLLQLYCYLQFFSCVKLSMKHGNEIRAVTEEMISTLEQMQKESEMQNTL